ncbi:MAG: hypothetical protein IPG60_01970 [Bacteroidetes bacterium]|nr:hypothetical protein [Bacteroidota bacterium]
MQKLKIAAALIIIVMFAISCSPELKLQNTLTKDGGRWNIDELKVNTTVQLDPPVYSEEKISNQGELLFYESGTGIWIGLDTTLNVDVAQYFEYENTSNTILINFENSLEQEYNVEQTNKDKQIWTREESIVDPITSVTIIINTQITISRVNEIKNK